MNRGLTKKDLDDDLDKLTKGLNASLDNLAIKLIKHVDGVKHELKQDIAKVDIKYGHIVTTLDDIEVNDAVRDVQLARHEKWFGKLSAKAHVKLVH